MSPEPDDPYRLRRARAWLFDRAFPLWAGEGLDRVGGGSVETLAFGGGPGGQTFKRTRVQARQVYAFTQAGLWGWRGGEGAAAHCLAYLEGPARRADGGYVRLTARDGGAFDPAADAYDMAFVLFALAARLRAGDQAALSRAHAVMDAYDRLFALPEGWREAEDRPLGRQQNPHMHLLEAALELAEAGRDERFAEVARAVLRLFETRLFDEKRGLLSESYAPDWSAPLTAPNCVEPGHLYEWVWLLGRARAVLGEDLTDQAAALYWTASEKGVDPATGLVHDALDLAALSPGETFRIWPQTEALKAHLAAIEHLSIDASAEVARVMGLTFDRYLPADLDGGWIDQFGPDWTVRSKDIPASILYHLVQAFAELFRLESRLAPTPWAGKQAPLTETGA